MPKDEMPKDDDKLDLSEGEVRKIARALGLDEEELVDAICKRRLSREQAVRLALRPEGVTRVDPGEARAVSAESTRTPSKKRR